MIFTIKTQPPEPNSTVNSVLTIILIVCLVLVILRRLLVYIHQYYALKRKKPLFSHTYFYKSELPEEQQKILKNDFAFYERLNDKDKANFRHRLATFMGQKKFIGREGLVPNDEMKILISATAIMLTFGFKDYLIKLIEVIVIYPKAYYSQINQDYHKGETNPQLKTIVFSWEDFKKGYHIGDDNLNLGIHEFGHAIHLNAFGKDDVSSLIFNQGFRELTDYLQQNQNIRMQLINSKYFRTYAFTNHYEFFAVLLENFIETPREFNSQFPRLYGIMSDMLNFKFAGY